MKTIILTGGIGSGKSTASLILRELGAAIISTDQVARDVVDPGTPGWQEVVDTFGREILSADNAIDRPVLARVVFHNPEKLQKLNHIIHPRVDQAVETRLDEYQAQGKPAAFVEMGFIIEKSWMSRVDEVWVVKTPREVILKRLQGRGMTESEALARMANQTPPEETVKKGGLAKARLVLIDNSGNLNDLKARVEKLWNKIDNE